jgi:CubicO group peptidase (beta-lactamase class C family)
MRAVRCASCAVTVREAMAHRAGLAALREDIDLRTALNWTAMTERIAAAAPLWQPGTGHAYHALTYGWIVGEVLRRITGRLPGDLLRTTMADPLGADMWIGIPASVEPEVARLRAGASLTAPPEGEVSEPDAATAELQDLMGRSMTLGAAFPPDLVVRDRGFDAAEVHQGQVPGAGGIASARGLASVWSSAVVPAAGLAPLSSETREDMTRVQSEGSQVWPVPAPHSRWGTGFMISMPSQPMLTEQSFGHEGAGGQLAFADPVRRVGFAHVTNVFEGTGDDRAPSVVDALREVLVTAR